MIEADLLVFDLDDTLLDTTALFTRIKQRFFEHLVRAGLNQQQIETEYERIDETNIARFGYISERTIISLRETMESLYPQHGIPFSQPDLEILATVGSSGLYEVPGLMPYAASLLSWCKERFRLALLTRGSISYQQVKLQVSGLGSSFESAKVVPAKSETAFAELLRSLNVPPSRAVSIGDSARFDIVPALSIGMRAIHVRYSRSGIQWNHDREAPDHPVAICAARNLEDVQVVLEGRTASVSGEKR